MNIEEKYIQCDEHNKWVIVPGWVDYVICCHVSEIYNSYSVNLELSTEAIVSSSYTYDLMKQETLNILGKYFNGDITIKDFKKAFPYVTPDSSLVRVSLYS